MQEKINFEELSVIIDADKKESQVLGTAFKYLVEEGKMKGGVKLVCIDGRRTDNFQSDNLNEVAVPGGGLGVLMDVHTAVENILGPEETKKVEEALYVAVKTFLNVERTSAHTDDHSTGEENVFFHGCGHCLGIFNNKVEHGYNTTPLLIEFVKKLEENEAGNFDTDIYKGKHVEEGVVIVNSTNTALDSYVGESKQHQIFVYHKEWHKVMYQKLSRFMSENISALNGKQVELELELMKLINMDEQSRLMATVGRLAGQLVSENRIKVI